MEVPDGDILIHAGDISTIGEENIMADFNNWLGQLPHRYKIVIAGNHDLIFEQNPAKAKSLLSNAIYLNDSGIEIEGLQIWGSPISPVSPKFGSDWAFNRTRGQEIRRHWELIPSNIDILITHCPPFGILDENESGDQEGCRDLMDLVQNNIKPRLHIFGHIHEAYGQIKLGNTHYVNASVVGFQNWIADYKTTRLLRRMAIYTFRVIKRIRKLVLGVSKDNLYSKKLSHLQ